MPLAEADATGCIADGSSEKAPDAVMVQKAGVRVGEGLRVPRRGSRVEFERTESRSDPPDVDL